MPISSRTLVEFVLLGPTNDRRQLQDSPILGDVWIAFAAKPAKPMDLLITPYKTQAAGPLAVIIAERIAKLKVRRKQGEEAHIAYLQGLVAARLFFREVLRIIVPMTQWWRERKVQDALQHYTPEILSPKIAAIIKWAQAGDEDAQAESAEVLANFTALDRYVALAGIILWASTQEKKATVSDGGIGSLMTEIKGPEAIVTELRRLFVEILQDAWLKEAQIWQVSLNRKAMPALAKSVSAVKGDAARSLFNVKCNDITWAVMDSGIDGGHEVFKDEQGKSRIVRAFDFSNIREIVSLDNLNTRTATFKRRLGKLLKGQDRKAALEAEEATQILKALAQDADNDRPIHWELVEKFIEIKPETPPRGGHGTHVAGIIGANSKVMKQASHGMGTIAEQSNDDNTSSYADGMCPDIKFYDFRVLAKSVQDTEFAIIAALAQFIAVCRRSKWSKHRTNSPLLALLAMTGSSAARKISSACSQAFC